MSKHTFFTNKTDTGAGVVFQYPGGKGTVMITGTVASTTEIDGEISDDGTNFAELKAVDGTVVNFDSLTGATSFDIDIQSDTSNPIDIRLNISAIASSTVTGTMYTED